MQERGKESGRALKTMNGVTKDAEYTIPMDLDGGNS